jgi:hypothetical protein
MEFLPQLRARRSSAYPLDCDFFASVDTEPKAYFLGFLAADGYVAKSGKWIACCVSGTDFHILEEMRLAMGSGAPIAAKFSRGGYLNSKPQRVITFCSRKLVGDLASLGIAPGKSKNLTYPQIPADVERHFLRGLLDGDGWITPRQFGFLGTPDILDGICEAVLRHTGQALAHSPYASGHGRLIGYRRNRDVLRWLYTEAGWFLRRKYQKVLDSWT